MPTGIPDDVVHIDLSHNSIRHLKARDFQGARSLRTLNLNNNNMEHIDTGETFYVLKCFSNQCILLCSLNNSYIIEIENQNK